MTRSERFSLEADRLLVLGDQMSPIDLAESKRLLRECRRYRALARAALVIESAKPSSDRMAVGE